MHPSQVDPEREVEWDGNASTLNNDDDDAQERKQCWSGSMESPDARKAAKAGRKAAKNQVLFDVITQQELAMVEKALHPQSGKQASAVSNGQGLADNRTIEENIAFNSNTVKWSKIYRGNREEKIAKSNGGKQKPNTIEQDNRVLSPIFDRLGISTDVSKANRERKSLDAKLRAAILGDLLAFENDQVETMQRMAGYWRYANKRIYNEMVRNNEIWDWATGEKLPEIREEAELDVIEEEPENGEAGTQGVDMEGPVPDNWDDPDFELPAGATVLSLAPLIDRSNNNRKQSGSDTNLDEEVEAPRDHISISKLSSSPGRPTVQTLCFNVPSPNPSDETWERLRAESEHHTEEVSETLKGSSTTRNPLSPMTSNPKHPHEKGFQGVKDTRSFETAIRKALPSSKDTPRAPQPTTSALLPPATQKRDPLNRFGALDREVPAPSEEVKKVDQPALIKSVVRIPAKPIVKRLVMHKEQDDWTTTRAPLKGKKGAKGGSVVALREQAAVDVHHARKYAGGKSFAAAVRRGK